MHSDPKMNATDVDAPEDAETNEQEEFVDPAETVVMSETDFSEEAGEPSVEINVEELVAKVERESDVEKKKAVRRRLEELAEEQSFEDTYAIDFDD